MRRSFGWLGLAAIVPWLAIPAVGGQSPSRVDYGREIGPLLKSKCASCHGAGTASGGLRLDSIEAIQKGGASGPLFVPGKGASSLLVARLRGSDGKPRMPMGFAPLGDEQIRKVELWIDQGARFGETGRSKHWAYTAPVRPSLPPVSHPLWIRNPIDGFVLSRLEREGLRPSPEASADTLARRAALDLTGLPPTVEELDRFLADHEPNAYERYVDRLLSSPHYGEKMARTWLDLARYADTNGYEKDLPRSMWPWRDWVIKAFNANMPYDRFTVAQLAGDLVPHPTRDDLVATGFHRNSMLNDEGGIDPEEFRVVAVMDRLDATATTWLGSTLACAQCHDHKYDPFSQKDYYRFFAFFNRSQDNGRDIEPILRLPSAEQQTVLDDLEKRRAKAASELRAAESSRLSTQPLGAKWLQPIGTAIAAAAKLTALPDGSFLASGEDPANDIYTVTLPVSGALCGIRLEVLPDPSLPTGSSGRNPNGSFVLGRVEIRGRFADASTRTLSIREAVADYTQPGHDPRNLITGTGNGWAASAFQPEHRVVHTVVMDLGTPIPGPFGGLESVTVTLRHHPSFPHHNIGRFRISVTSDAELARRTPPTSAVSALLTKSGRTASEEETVQMYLRSSSPQIRELKSRIEGLERMKDELMSKSPLTMVMRDLDNPRPDRILKRGDFRTPGDPVSPGVPLALGGAAVQPNRLGLAKWLVDPKNPLTARVEANRLWEQCFGRGLVATMEDFGTQGEPPSHPELLDWLATEMIARKWDVKAMLRLIVTSATYRQSSKVSPEMQRRDPYNVLLARGARFRLEAEGVRDIALAASGRLSLQIGGPSVMPPQPGGIWENSFSFYDTKERWVDATGPNRYRRGLYTYWRRTAPFPMALTFDQKSRDMCVAHRSRTNTPLQALNTLNDPLFIECAGKLAETIGKKGLTYAFRACTGRRPSAPELRALQKLEKAAEERFKGERSAANQLANFAKIQDPGLAAKIVVANTLLNLDETITRN